MTSPRFKVDNLHSNDIATCTRKVTIGTKQNARMAAARASRRGAKVRFYECGVCGHFHLTSSDLEIERRRRR
jgi:hypothetical protein